MRYVFDGWMSKGTGAVMLLLAGATIAFVLLVGLVVTIAGIRPSDHPREGFLDIVWGNLMRTLDPGTMGGDSGWAFRIAMLVVTVGGLVIVASLIGIVSSGFDARVADLRKGRSRVLERDHTLLLGWSSKVFPVIRELVAAAPAHRRTVVVLAPRDKVAMEEAIRAEVGPMRRTRVICRSGGPMNLHDLELGSPHTARSIVLLAPEDGDGDSSVIKTALALTNHPGRRSARYRVVGELGDTRNREAARLVGRDEVHWVLASELISRLTVQTCRQSGLSVVCTELLDFDGDEIYFATRPELTGWSYGRIRSAFADSAVIGVVSDGVVRLGPPADHVHAAGDQVILIAEDQDAIRTAPAGAADETAIVAPQEFVPQPERTLILGVNDGLPMMLAELRDYVAPRSSVTVVADVPEPAMPELAGLDIRFLRGDTTSRSLLERVDVRGYDHVIVLAERTRYAPERADARTLVTLLHLREITNGDAGGSNVVSEMIDDRNRELAEVTNADDFIVSDRLVSLMLSQISENARLSEVFETLFSSGGSEIYLKPADLYIAPGAEVDFYTVLEAAGRAGETAIGYRLQNAVRDPARDYGVVLNPAKGDRITFAPGDRVIVLVES